MDRVGDCISAACDRAISECGCDSGRKVFAAISSYVFKELQKCSAKKHRGCLCLLSDSKYEEYPIRALNKAIKDSMLSSGISPLDVSEHLCSIVDSIIFATEDMTFGGSERDISFSNAVLNLDTLAVSDDPNGLSCLHSFPFDYDPYARFDLWVEFLRKVLPDAASMRTLQEFIGASLEDRSAFSIDKMLVILGSDPDAKWIIRDVILNLFGSNNASASDFSDLVYDDRKDAAIHSIDGMFINYSEDLQTELISDQFSIAQFNNVVCGVTPIGQNRTPLLISNAYSLPDANSIDSSLFDRIIIIPVSGVRMAGDAFNRTEFVRKISEINSGIFNWALEGLKSFRSNDRSFKRSIASSVALARYRLGNSSVLSWVEDAGYSAYPIELGRQAWVCDKKDAYSYYKLWCLDNKIKATTTLIFNRDMDSMGFKTALQDISPSYMIYNS